jgi:cytochrome b561
MHINNPMTKKLMAMSPLPVSLQYVMLYAGLWIVIVSGIFMLQGKNWARFLYVIWCSIGAVVEIITSPMKAAMVPGLVVFAIIVFFLFRPKANAYFAPREAADNRLV